MDWTISLANTAKKQLARLDRQVQRRITGYLRSRVSQSPRDYGEALTGNLSGLWKYRVGDYRLIAEIRDNEFIVLVIRLGHRSEVYKRQ